MKPIRIIVTGSRSWTDHAAIWGALDLVAEAARATGSPLVLAHGCAKGADVIADRWAGQRRMQGWPIEVERFPALWRTHGKRAGLVRNAEMVKPGADVCLAFILDGSRGATHCADLAEANDIRTQRVERYSDDPPEVPGG